MTSRMYLATTLVITLSLFCSCDRGKVHPFAKARSTIEKFMRERRISSFQVAVAKDGTVIWEEAFGWANVKERVPATNETMFLVASIEKPFVSTAIMRLAEQGKLNLYNPINNYLGPSKLSAYNGDASRATVARLLLHVSGLPSGYYICSDSFPREKRRSNDDLLGLAGVLVYPPGTVYEYSNYGYGLLDDIVKNAAGEQLQEYIMREIVSPLGLAHTRYFKFQPPKEMIATQNVQDGTLPFFLNLEGYSGLYSTAGDLARFGMFHLKNRLPDQKPILSDSSIDLLRTYQEPGVATTSRTLAWDVQRDYGYIVAMHGGGGPGIHNYLYMIPSENLVIAHMSNAQYVSSDRVLVELIAAALPEFGLLNRMKGRNWPEWPEIDQTRWEGEWKGTIRGPKGSCSLTLRFSSSGIPKLRFENGTDGGLWISPNRGVQKGYGKVCYRFDTQIPYLIPFAKHDEVILVLKPDGNLLIGSASAAKEKNFGKDENYVLPQYLELTRATPATN